MKKHITFLFVFILSSSLEIFSQNKAQTQASVDSLLPTNNSKYITAERLRLAFEKTLNFADKSYQSRRKSVKDYGALGNGVADETAAIQACINAEKEVYIPAGTYLISSSLNIPSNRIIYGDGASTILKANAHNIKVLNIKSTAPLENIIVSNLAINGGGQLTSTTDGIRAAIGVYVSNAHNININNLFITKCGVMNGDVNANTATITNDNDNPSNLNPTGGYGILIEARHGLIENIYVSNCTVTYIAGGGNVFGDGIYVAGYNSNLSIVPKSIWIENCYVENVGRHCYAVAGEGTGSKGYNVTIRGCTGKNSALCGIDLEEASQTLVEDVRFENCGNYSGYYNSPQRVWGTNYRLCAAIAYGNESNNNTFRNITITNSYYGITLSAGRYVSLEELTIMGSTKSDLAIGNARFGENLSVKNCKFLTDFNNDSDSTTAFNWYNATSNSGLLVENCIFNSATRISGVKVATFRDCIFNRQLFSTNAENGDIQFEGCKFLASTGFNGVYFSEFNTYCKNFKFINCDFIGSSYGIFAKWKSIKDLVVENCTFKNIINIGVYCANSENDSPFASISRNIFDGMKNGIKVNFGMKYASIIGNRFRNISQWCINNADIYSSVSTTDCIFSDNIAIENCVNGLQIQVSTGSIDYLIITRNNMRACTGVKANISSGNTNGFSAQNIF